MIAGRTALALIALVLLLTFCAAAEARTLVIGDQIAHGIRRACRCPGETRAGADTRDVLAFLFRARIGSGDTVVLSSGVSASPQWVAEVDIQLRMIRPTGARVVLLGVGPRFASLNAHLAAIAAEHGAHFVPLGETADGVHPRNYQALARALLRPRP